MKDSTAVKLYLGVCLIVIGILIYAVATDGWYYSEPTVLWTVIIFGGVGLILAVLNKLTKQ